MPALNETTTRWERVSLVALLVFTCTAVAGYWNFALHPERLPASPAAVRFYTISFQFFAQLHIVVSAVALATVLVGRLRARWLSALLAVYALAFLAEHVGTGYGIPFGGYGYTALLGMKVGGRVPALIPLSWFLMSLPSWVVARRAYPRSAWRRITLAAAMLVAWDLALDPAMSYLTPYWVWEHSGPYYGMPWVNLLGWFVTGVVIMTVLERLDGRLGLDVLPVRFMVRYYLLVLLMPVGMLAAAGHLLAVAVTVAGVGVCAFFARGALAPAPGTLQAGRAEQGERTPAGAREPASLVATP
jgi:putative membrane protein